MRQPQLEKVIWPEDRKLRLPWWGVLCVILGALPVLFLFDHFGRFDLARPSLTSVAIIAIVIALRWQWRGQVWFWSTVAVFAALHLLLILLVPWSTRWIPAAVIIPIGMADMFVMLWVLFVVAKLMDRSKVSV